MLLQKSTENIHWNQVLDFFFKALKYDAVRSILSRCEVLCEDVMDSQEEKTTNGTFILHVIY